MDFDGTDDDVIYLTGREGVFSYNIAVPPGTYDIILHFAELYV
jgi:Malectin domain